MSFKDLPVVKPELLSLGRKLGEDRIRVIVRRFYDRLAADVMVGFYFAGKDVAVIADRQTHFLLKAFGLTTSYEGLPPSSAHGKLAPILSGHFDRRLQILDETLKSENLSTPEREAWVGFENAFRGAIVSRT